MLACEGKLNHLGIDYFPKRSTLSDANSRREPVVFEQLYYALLNLYSPVLSDSCPNPARVKNLFLMDSTVISLFSDVLKGATKTVNGKQKGGLKIHTLMKASDDVPCLINLTASACNDVKFLSQIKLSAGSWLVFDRGYRDYSWFTQMTLKDIFFVTRENAQATFQFMRSGFNPPNRKSHELIEDRHIHIIRNHVKLCLRRIVWNDVPNGRTLVFLTNNFKLAAHRIAQLYKCRWQIETLFKRLKQNFCIKYFLGDSENAIKIQVWVCLIAHLILKVIQLQAKRKWAFSNLTALIRYHLMSYIRLFDFLANPFAGFEKLTTKTHTQIALFPT
jgi:hypothetical protein